MNTVTTAHERRKAGPPVSVQAIRWARRQQTGSPTSKAVLYVLADHADRTGCAWPTTRTIADEADTDPRTARRQLERLRERGLITWEPGAGRGANRYQLALSSEGPEHSQQTAVVEGDTPTTAERSGALGDRSGALISRSGATRASDQQEREQKHLRRSEERRSAAATQQPRASARGGGEHVPAAELARTAHRPTASVLVTAWAERNPGVANGHRRELAKAVDDLLAQRADPALIPAALDEAHSPRFRSPAKALALAYDDVRRARSPSQPLGRVPTSVQRVNDIQTLRRPETGDLA